MLRLLGLLRLLWRPALQKLLDAAGNSWELQDEGQHVLRLDAADAHADRGAPAVISAAQRARRM